jgi:hypothetical protein
MDKFIKKSKKHEIFYYEKKLKKLFSLGIIFLLLAPAFLSFLPVPQVKAEKGSTQEFWVPLVFSKAWSGDFGHSIEIYKIEDSEYFVERGSLNNPSIGTHIVVTKGSIMASYFWLNNDLGAWDDDVLGYTILPSSKLGTEYLIPVGGTVSVVATQPYTTVSYKGGGSPKILVDAGSYFQFVSSDGGWIKADKPVAVAVGNVDVKTKSDTYAYAPLPNNLLGTHYHFSKREPMDSYFKNQADLSKLVIMATEQGAKVSIGGEALSLSAYGFKVIENPNEDLKITSDQPISVVYLQRIRYTDPWTGDVRYASYAYSLIPKNLWGTSYILFEGWKYHLITEETVNVQIGEKPTRQYSAGVHDLGFQDKTSVIKSDKPINLVKIAISRWAGKYFPRGDAYEVFPTEFYTSANVGYIFTESPKADGLTGYIFVPTEAKLYLQIPFTTKETFWQEVNAAYLYSPSKTLNSFSVKIPATISYWYKLTGVSFGKIDFYLKIYIKQDAQWKKIAESKEIVLEWINPSIISEKNVTNKSLLLLFNFPNTLLEAGKLYKLEISWGVLGYVQWTTIPSTSPYAPPIEIPLGTFIFGGNAVYGSGPFASAYGLLVLSEPEISSTMYPEGSSPKEEKPNALVWIVHSPVYLYITDPAGRHVGFDPKKSSVINEITGAYFTGLNETPQVIAIPVMEFGAYKSTLIGIKSGSYTIIVNGFIDGKKVYERTYTEKIEEGQIAEFIVTISKEPTGEVKMSVSQPTTLLSPTITTPTSPTQTQTTSPSAAAPLNIELIIIIIVIAATLASLVIVFRKYKAK